MTEKDIIEIWNSIPPQGDTTGKKFAVKFAEAVIDAYCERYELITILLRFFRAKAKSTLDFIGEYNAAL